MSHNNQSEDQKQQRAVGRFPVHGTDHADRYSFFDAKGRPLRRGDLIRTNAGAVWSVGTIEGMRDGYGRLRMRTGKDHLCEVMAVSAARPILVDERTGRLVEGTVFLEL